jgi:hypothetical protein
VGDKEKICLSEVFYIRKPFADVVIVFVASLKQEFIKLSYLIRH